MKTQAIVARNLKKLRLKRGISQENLAVDAEIDTSYLSGLESGHKNPTVAILERLAAALDVPVGAFFVEPAAGEKPPRPLPKGRKAKR